MAGTCRRFGLLETGDRILVAISGGKDSYAMLVLLHEMRRKLPFPIELVAVHLDQAQPGYDGSGLRAWLETKGWDHRIIREDTFSVVTEHLAPTQTYCSLCSRLRRGILYTAAEELGCNKVALGHHRNDSLETFLLNLFYAGKLQAMPAVYRTDDDRFTVIRPLIEADEDAIRAFVGEQDFPIIPCKLCGSQDNLKREEMKKLLSQLEAGNPNLRAIMMHALGNVSVSHLLDPTLRRAEATGDEAEAPRPRLKVL